jgi:hypothetical protein
VSDFEIDQDGEWVSVTILIVGRQASCLPALYQQIGQDDSHFPYT